MRPTSKDPPAARPWWHDTLPGSRWLICDSRLAHELLQLQGVWPRILLAPAKSRRDGQAGEGADRQTGLGDGDELVADAALADDAPGGLRVVLQLLAEAADVHLQVVDLVGVLAAPHLC